MITTSKALQQYYRARHVKLTRGHANTTTLLDSQTHAMQARDFIQGFKRKHTNTTKKQYLAWLLK